MFDERICNDEIRKLIDIFMKEIPMTNQYSCGESRHTLARYYDTHHKRFIEGIKLIEKHIEVDNNWSALEAGSPFPFYTYYFSKAFNWNVDCLDISTAKSFIITDLIVSRYGNLCIDDLGVNKYELITACEVWEHLPCNLYNVKERILRSLKPNGYLLCSYPLGGKSATLENYNRDWDINMDKFHGHLREFTKDTALKFINELSILQTQDTPTNCMHILYKKEV